MSAYSHYQSYSPQVEIDDNPTSKSGVATRLSQDGSMESLGINRYDPTDSLDTSSAHPLAAATDSYGRFVPFHKLTEDSQVTLDGTKATLGQLEALGYAKRDNEGKWDVVNPELVKQGQAAEAEQAAIDYHNSLDLHPTPIENRLNYILEPVPQPVYDSALAKYVSTLDTDKLDVSGIAAASGMSDVETKQHISFIKDSFDGQVRSKLGDDTDAVMKWAKTNKPAELKQAVQMMLSERKLDGIKDLHNSFKSDCSTEAQQHTAVNYLRSQGISVNKKNDVWVVKTNVGETSLENAFKQGYIHWSGGKAK